MPSKTKIIGFIDNEPRISGKDFFGNISGLKENYELKILSFNPSMCDCSYGGIFPKTDKYYDEMLYEINKCDIIVTGSFVCAAFVNDMEIQWFHSISSGVDTMIKQLKPDRPPPSFQLTRQGGSYGRYMKEYVIGQIIASERGFYKSYDNQKKEQWVHNKIGPQRLLTTLSISILGLGDIGREVAEYCQMLGIKVYGMVKSIPTEKPLCIHEYFTLKELPKYLEISDYVCSILPNTKLTNNIFSNGMLKHCAKKQSVLINIGRGNIYSENDIVEAIEKKWIRGAVLDTFDHEPLPTKSMLWNLPNVIITPHNSSITDLDALCDLFMENLELFEKGEEMRYLVNWKKGY